MQKPGRRAPSYVFDLRELDESHVARAGGKGANLGALTHIDGVRVPRGFCVTTDAFAHAMASLPDLEVRLLRLARCEPNDLDAIRDVSATLRRDLESCSLPSALAAAVGEALEVLGETTPCVVRSSATAEDLPTTSFAGLHDSYLGIVSTDEVLRHIRRCWGSLFTERAVSYRRRNGPDDRQLRMAVVVQEMVAAQAAGILFTADPVSGNRHVTSVEATPGLGAALVSGRVTPAAYTLRDAVVLTRSLTGGERTPGATALDGASDAAGERDRQLQAVLSDAQLVRLERLGRRIETRFGTPQDIEWCLRDDEFYVVQSRPITTLFPIPEVDDGKKHVYLSVGHQQMMTDALKPLGLSFWQMTTPRPMAEAGGRLFVDVAAMLSSPASRANLLEMIGRSDVLMRDALQTVLDRRGFIEPAAPDAAPAPLAVERTDPLDADPAIVASLIASNRSSLEQLRREIAGKSGAELFDFIREDMQELRRQLHGAESHRAVMAGIEATWWINDRMQEWLGEANAADTLAQSAPNNVTSEMGLELLDVADAMRPHPQVVAFLDAAHDDDFVDRLGDLEGGGESRVAMQRWLDRYGVRGTGEIDITRPRWREHPAALLPLLRSNIRHFEAGAGARRFADGVREALRAEESLLERVRALRAGDRKANDTKRMIDRLRAFIGYREYPKYGMVSRYFAYKEAILREADRLVAAGILEQCEDCFFLRFDELETVVRSRRIDRGLVRRRCEEYAAATKLRAPRVLTSEGDALDGAYQRDDAPEGALLGLAVSGGIVEGRARVVREIAHADLAPGDILVTPYTDPSWTPLFVTISGIVTEVGGQMTHGAVIAREYGIPAVVAVERATQRIHDGDRIRVNGSAGYVQLLS